MRTFALVALVSSFFVFFAFSIRLVWQEEAQMEEHLKSFKGVAEQFYKLSPKSSLALSEHVTVYYGEADFTDQLQRITPIPVDSVNRLRYEFRISDDQFLHAGIVAYHFAFEYQGKLIQTYITISSFNMDLWDDSWDGLMLISTLLMIFLIVVLRFTLKRVVDQIMSPITELSSQLRNHQSEQFYIPPHSVDELAQLTAHLNSYSTMKDRLAKQELMFAKYASHELKTPIAIILSAAELQAMKPQDSDFQAKQRERILIAVKGMRNTVEALLNIVKQENASTERSFTPIDASSIDLEKYQAMLADGVTLSLDVAPNTQVNMPLTLVEMVLKNYIENAIRFTPSGEIAVTISSDTISVSDTGCGITSKSKTEHGLGLIIVERIGKSYGWTSTLNNRTDQTAKHVQSGCVALFVRENPTA
ncbi:sensor histidine kinase [Vibrio sinensis]|uniref:histidine kinase n=1 Tax=Vibrio sinensis TaxID=2302434 RepID=A0A3A6QGH3_9VIBR|nr:HAMP domain-containing sensor histidine kinase [Vibrio sinensis]RJX71980.1 sensor histidine kinase [Vibrio sinensis]